jgi:hypothetical protein
MQWVGCEPQTFLSIGSSLCLSALGVQLNEVLYTNTLECYNIPAGFQLTVWLSADTPNKNTLNFLSV